MSEEDRQHRDAEPGRAGGTLAFVAVHLALLLYLRFWVNPAFVYFWPGTRFPDFLMHVSFFRQFLGLPAGISAYAGGFASQLLYFPWVGAAAITAASAIICALAATLVRRLTGLRPTVLHLGPAVIAAVCYGQYENALPMMLIVAAAGLAAALYSLLPVSRPLLRAVLAVPGSLAAYYLLGGAYLVVAALCVVLELKRRAVVPLLANVCAAAAVPLLVGMGWLHCGGLETYQPLLAFQGAGTSVAAGAVVCLFAVLPFCLLAAWLGAQLAPRRLPRRLLAMVFCIVAAGAVWVLGNAELRTGRALEYACSHRQWRHVLNCARRLPSESYMQRVDMSVNLALYHCGRMGDDLFFFPQQRFGIFRCPEEYWGAVQMGAEDPHHDEFMRGSDIFYELGRMNEAEHMAIEALYRRARPWALERLAMIRLVKGDPESARTYLQILEGDVIWRRRARRMLAVLEQDPDALARVEVGRLRKLMLPEDGTGLPLPADILRQCLAANESNRMAFEYLMTDYLLKGVDLDGLAGEMHRLGDLGYERIPRLYEEALLVRLDEGKPLPDLGMFEISAESKLRFADFMAVLDRHAGDTRAALAALDPLARFSFMAYYFLHLQEGGAT